MSYYKPHTYKHCAKAPRGILVQNTLDKYAKKLVWKNDGTDTLLDIGCGTGDLALEFFIPLMPLNYKQFVGYDISSDMVKYAKAAYGSEKIQFEVVNVESDLTGKIEKMKKFDHAISTFALQWVPNMRKAISNISNFLTENGDIILVIVARPAMFDFINQLITTKRWGPLLSQYKPFWNESFNRDIYEREFKSYLTDAGFRHIDIEITPGVFNFVSREEFKLFFYAINPVHDLLSQDQREEMFDEFVVFNETLNNTNPLKEIIDESLCYQSELLTGYASKQKCN